MHGFVDLAFLLEQFKFGHKQLIPTFNLSANHALHDVHHNIRKDNVFNPKTLHVQLS